MKRMKNMSAALFLGLLTCGAASAQTWTGDDLNDDNWSSGDNWGSDVAPVNSGTVVFPNWLTPGATWFDLTGLRLGSLTLNSTAGSGWTINGADLLGVIQAGGGTTVFTSQGTATNTIATDLSFVNADGSAATDRAALVMRAPHRVDVTGNVHGYGLRLSGSGEMAVDGNLTLTMPDGGSSTGAGFYSINMLDVNTTLRFTGDSFTSNDATVNMEGGILIWDSAAPMSKFLMGVRGGHIVTAQNIDKRSGLNTGNNLFQINVGATSVAGFSALGDVRDISLNNGNGETLIWSSEVPHSTLIMFAGVLELNTHDEANDQIRWTSDLNLRDNTAAEVNGKTIRVGDVAGVEIDAIFSGVIGDRGSGTHKNNLRIEGPGVLSLTGNNNNLGDWEVASGTLLINGTTSGQGDYVVGGASIIGDATLGGAGTLGLASGKSVTVVGTENFSARLAPGNGTGTLTVNGDVVLGDYGVLRIRVDGAECGTLVIDGDIDLSSMLNTLEVDGTPVQSYTIATYSGALIGEFATEPTLPSGYAIDYGTGSNSEISIWLPPSPGSLFLMR